MGYNVAMHTFTGQTALISSYDSSKTCIGAYFIQSTGASATDKFIGPCPILVGRNMEMTTAVAGALVHVYKWSDNIHWVFLGDCSSAATTRKVIMYEHNLSANTLTWKGAITLNWSLSGNKTMRGLRALVYEYSTGTVAVAGTAVTGTDTAWQTARVAVGARIGFGSTDPTEITNWYPISAIASDTGLTLENTAGTIDAGSSYVIEELRIATVVTNATATNGGLFLAKGLNPEVFTAANTNIAQATDTDNIRAVYWLADASSVANTTGGGLGVDDTFTNTQHYCWVINGGGGTTATIFKYNLRAALSPSSSKATDAFVLKTGNATTTGNISQVQNGRIFSIAHGDASGVKSFWFVTASRIYRVPESSIEDGSTTFLSAGDQMNEIPPGGTSTYAASGALSSVDYSDFADRLIIMTTAASSTRSYVTAYNTISSPMELIFLADDKQLDQSSSDSGGTIKPTILATVMSAWTEAGYLYLARHGTSATTNQVYVIPFGAHWTYAAAKGQRVITPALSTPGATRFDRVFVNATRQIGDSTFGTPPEAFRVYYRTAGISDNSGDWTLLDETGVISGLDGAESIQLMFEFKTLGTFCVPARIYNCGVVYQDSTTNSHYQPSVALSSIANKIFAWRFGTAWGSTVPTLYIKLYNAVTGDLLVSDDTASPSGTFEKSTDDGDTWSAYDTDDKGNDTTYIRYTPASLADDVKVRALLI